MDLESKFAHVFKPEVRKQGRELVDKNVISISNLSDTRVEAFVAVSAAARVVLSATDISSESMTAVCNCSAFAKGQYCKHIWGTLLKAEASGADFLESKSDVGRGEVTAKAVPKLQPRMAPPISEERQRALNERKEADRARASEYRKAQYQRYKTAQKDRKRGSSAAEKHSAFQTPEAPDEVRDAIAYFEANGFQFSTPIDLDALKSAKRLLSRVFHPDKGGSHDEILALNENFDRLVEFSRNEA